MDSHICLGMFTAFSEILWLGNNFGKPVDVARVHHIAGFALSRHINLQSEGKYLLSTVGLSQLLFDLCLFGAAVLKNKI